MKTATEIREAYIKFLEQGRVAEKLDKERSNLYDKCVQDNPLLSNQFTDKFPQEFQELNQKWYDAARLAGFMQQNIIGSLDSRVCRMASDNMFIVPIEDEGVSHLEIMGLMPE